MVPLRFGAMKLALGTVQFGLDYGVANRSGRVADAVAGAILRLARSNGIDTLDTAIAYGKSEAVLGGVGVADWKIVSKLPPVPDGIADVAAWARQQVLGTLDRLRVPQLHAVLLHRPAQLHEPVGPALLDALHRLKAEGLARGIGISIYAADELPALTALAHFDLVQAPLNIVDRRLLDSGWAARLHEAGTEVHTRSAFMQGLLLMPPAERPAKFDRWSPLWQAWGAWLAANDLSALEACIRFPLSIPGVDRVVVGVDGVDHLEQILLAAGGPLPPPPTWPPLTDDRLLDPSTWNSL